MRRAVTILALLVVNGCATTNAGQATPKEMPFPDAPAELSEYGPFLSGGNGIVTGQAFMKTRGGDVKLAAGNPVHLDPATTYSKSWLVLRGDMYRYFHDAVPDSLFTAARKVATADAQGKFRFEGLAPGLYYVTTYVRWETGGAYTPTQGGVLADSVRVEAGKTTDIVMTR